MYTKWKTWAHVTKLDPDKNLNEEQMAEIATSGTDALMLSGTLNITRENMQELRIRSRSMAFPWLSNRLVLKQLLQKRSICSLSQVL